MANDGTVKLPHGPADTTVMVDIVIPVLNEVKVLGQSIETLRAFLTEHASWPWRIVIADNGSYDGTDKVARDLAERYSDVRYTQLPEHGRGRALRFAWTQSDADVMCYTDVDLSTELAALPTLVHAVLHEGYDLGTGSRLLPASKTRRSFKREVVSRIYNLIVKIVLGTGFSDAQCGFKVVSRAVAHDIVPQVKDNYWFFDTELLTLAERRGYRIKDLAVAWVEDSDTRVKIIPTALKDLRGVWRLRTQFWRESLSPRRRTAVAPSKSGR